MTTVSLPTSVLKPIAVSRLSLNSMGLGSTELSLDNMLTQLNYCVYGAAFLAAAALLLAFLSINFCSINSTSFYTCLARCCLHFFTA